jgi:hypothetical protein
VIVDSLKERTMHVMETSDPDGVFLRDKYGNWHQLDIDTWRPVYERAEDLENLWQTTTSRLVIQNVFADQQYLQLIADCLDPGAYCIKYIPQQLGWFAIYKKQPTKSVFLGLHRIHAERSLKIMLADAYLLRSKNEIQQSGSVLEPCSNEK